MGQNSFDTPLISPSRLCVDRVVPDMFPGMLRAVHYASKAWDASPGLIANFDCTQFVPSIGTILV